MTKEELRQAIQDLPSLPETAPRHSWLRHRIDVRKRILRDNPDEFLTWPVIRGTMFVGDADYIKDELKYLLGITDKCVDSIYHCPQFGKNKPEVACTNLIHQTYHIKQWEDKSGLCIYNQNQIEEFGGGYGAMALICRRLGFDGHYFISDLPEFSLLQEFYLSNVLDNYTDNYYFNTSHDGGNDLFMALWSISEIEPSERHIPKAKSYLFAYAPTWGDYDNQTYFEGFMAGKPDYGWHNWTIPHLPNFRYLIGVKAGVSI